MQQEYVAVIFKIESDRLFNVSTRHTFVPGQPLPRIGDTVYLQPSVQHAGEFEVAARKFSYTPRGHLEAVEITVK